MIIWILFAVVSAATTAVLVHPLSSVRARHSNVGVDAHVYRDQLLELERELARQQIGANEYELAKAETARRLFKSMDLPRTPSGPQRSHRRVRLAVAAMLPLISIGVYASLGSPELESRPLQARLDDPGEDLAILVKKTHDHLVSSPQDGRGWDLLAPVLLKMGRADDAVEAYRSALRILGASVPRLGGLSEALMARSNGLVGEDVLLALNNLLQIDPANVRARFYIALSMEQAGRPDEARQAFEALAKQSPADAPWLPLVNQHIAMNGGAPAGPDVNPGAGAAAPGNPTQQDVTAADAGDRQQMIRGMVESLDAKLSEDPNNFEGWMRLVRSYAVLNDKDRAAGALKRGLAAFPPPGEQGRQLLALARELGIAPEGATQ
ncbi:c-type cytochrome biogenesis protein CcmI [Rhizobium laguerreae]|uniref:c-type cytochrome biogenesis protein CcmI n=1 Tax=Rhizobium TaxID=379 RepID=UPI003D7C5716